MQPVQVCRTTVCMLSEEALHVRAPDNSIACHSLVVRRGVRSRQAASIGCPQSLFVGDLPCRQPQDCLRRGDASVSRSQTWLSQDDQTVSRKEMYAVKNLFSIELTIFKLTKHDCTLATVIVLLNTCGQFCRPDSGRIDSPSLLVCHTIAKATASQDLCPTLLWWSCSKH